MKCWHLSREGLTEVHGPHGVSAYCNRCGAAFSAKVKRRIFYSRKKDARTKTVIGLATGQIHPDWKRLHPGTDTPSGP